MNKQSSKITMEISRLIHTPIEAHATTIEVRQKNCQWKSKHILFVCLLFFFCVCAHLIVKWGENRAMIWLYSYMRKSLTFFFFATHHRGIWWTHIWIIPSRTQSRTWYAKRNEALRIISYNFFLVICERGINEEAVFWLSATAKNHKFDDLFISAY